MQMITVFCEFVEFALLKKINYRMRKNIKKKSLYNPMALSERMHLNSSIVRKELNFSFRILVPNDLYDQTSKEPWIVRFPSLRKNSNFKRILRIKDWSRKYCHRLSFNNRVPILIFIKKTPNVFKRWVPYCGFLNYSLYIPDNCLMIRWFSARFQLIYIEDSSF